MAKMKLLCVVLCMHIHFMYTRTLRSKHICKWVDAALTHANIDLVNSHTDTNAFKCSLCVAGRYTLETGSIYLWLPFSSVLLSAESICYGMWRTCVRLQSPMSSIYFSDISIWYTRATLVCAFILLIPFFPLTLFAYDIHSFY